MSQVKPIILGFSLIEGEGINLDWTNPLTPIISVDQDILDNAQGGNAPTLEAGEGIEITEPEQGTLRISSTSAGLESIQAGNNISIDATNALNPIISSVGGSGSAVVVNTIGALEGYVGTEQVVFVRDDHRGGIFTKTNDALTADGGTIFSASGGGFWVRQFKRYNGISVRWFGAVGDGIVDDYAAIMATIDYITHGNTAYGITIVDRPALIFPDGIYRITQSIIIGGVPVSNYDAMFYQGADPGAPSYNLAELSKANGTLPISMLFGQRAYIFADFSPAEPTAAISYGCSGNAYGAQSTQSAIIDGLKVIVDSQFPTTPYNPIAFGSKAPNIIGIVMYMTTEGMTVRNCKFIESGYGLVANMGYFTDYQQMTFRSNNIGFVGIGGHSCTGLMFQADHCNLGYDIKLGAAVFNQMSTEQCKRAIHINGTNVTINGIYFEQLDQTSGINDYQVTIGIDGPISVNYTGINLNGGQISADNNKHILIKSSVMDCALTNTTNFGTIYVENNLTKVFTNTFSNLQGNTANVTQIDGYVRTPRLITNSILVVDDLTISDMPVYANETEAVANALVKGRQYQTPTGEVRIKL